ncbi:MAG: PQQ-dependent sugar dehydrogenase [Anaerolineae bacterium]
MVFLHSRRWRLVAFLSAAVLLAAGCSARGDVPGGGTTAANVLQTATARPVLTPSPAPVAPPTIGVSPVAPPAPTAVATMTAAALAPVATVPSLSPEPSSLAPQATPAQPPSPPLDTLRLALRPVVVGLRNPLYVTHAGDGSGRLFVVEQAGIIRVVADGRPANVPFLDIRDRVGSNAPEQGLLGLAFAPDYPSSRYFYVNYTDRRGDTVISRFVVTADPGVADPRSESLVLKIPQPAANHNGGMLLFGPDGYLWVGTGDGGAANDRFGNGQNPSTLLGKMLRLDVTSDRAVPYQVPADNPWVQADWNSRDMRDEVWAVGLRNPWRYSFDRATGDLWIADVGQNLYEEVHYVPAGSPGGLNFGWPIMEGTHCFPETAACDHAGLEIPVVDYAHAGNGCSITGGYVYRGAASPALAGIYLYGDYCSGKIWGLAREGDGWRSALLLESGLNISSFGEDEAGELYVVDLRGGVYRVVIE